MKSYRLISILLNPLAELILRSPFRFLLPKRLVVMTYTGKKTHKKRSVIFHMSQYKDEFIITTNSMERQQGEIRKVLASMTYNAFPKAL